MVSAAVMIGALRVNCSFYSGSKIFPQQTKIYPEFFLTVIVIIQLFISVQAL